MTPGWPAIGVGVGAGVLVAAGAAGLVAVGGTGVAVGAAGAGVLVGAGAGALVAVGGTGVLVGGTLVAVGNGVGVGVAPQAASTMLARTTSETRTIIVRFIENHSLNQNRCQDLVLAYVSQMTLDK